MKTCSSCGQRKHHTKFYAGKPSCKECDKARVREWQKKNPDRVRAAVQRFREKNPGTDKRQVRAYNAAQRELRLRHPEEFDKLYRKHKKQVAS